MLTWVALIVLTGVWGAELAARDPGIRLEAAPLFGRLDPMVSLWVLPSVALGAAALVLLPYLDRIRWRTLLGVTALLAMAWPIALALTDGGGGLTTGLESRHDYLNAVPGIGSLGDFWRSFSERIADYPVHVQGHPPGMPTFLALLAGVGLGGSGWATAAVLSVAALAPIAVLISVRALGGETFARKAAPFLALSPAAIWIATSADAFFAGVGAWAVACLILASTGAKRRQVLAFAGGLLIATAILLSYGLVLLAAVVAPIVLARRAWGVVAVSVTTASAVLVLVAVVTDFNIIEGAAATRERYLMGVSASRPYSYFVIANLAAFAVVLGPAFFASVRNVPHPLMPLVAGAASAILLADLSGMSKGEVERIWLPFAPWLLWACAAGVRWNRRTLLAVQILTAVTVELLVVTPW